MQDNNLTYEQLIVLFQEDRKELAEIRKSMAETDKQIKELGVKINEQGININGIADSNGMVAETLISNTLEKSLFLNGWSFDYAEINVKKYIKKLEIRDQFDLILGNDNLVAIVEIKYKLRKETVLDVVDRKIPNYKKLFPNETRHIVGVVAGMSIDSQTIETAREKGIYAITLSGDQIKVENSVYNEFEV